MIGLGSDKKIRISHLLQTTSIIIFNCIFMALLSNLHLKFFKLDVSKKNTLSNVHLNSFNRIQILTPIGSKFFKSSPPDDCQVKVPPDGGQVCRGNRTGEVLSWDHLVGTFWDPLVVPIGGVFLGSFGEPLLWDQLLDACLC